MEELLKKAKEELKRVDHLIYVSLKYTRTVDVLHNVLERLISSFDFVVDALLERAKADKKIDELPTAPKLKCEALEKIYKGNKKILASVKEYMLMRLIIRLDHDRENEYRRHVAMIVQIDGEEIKIHIDRVTEYYKQAKELIEYIEYKYND